MADRSLAPRPATPEDRELAVAELCEHFAAGDIELDELEHRLAVADEVASEAELVALVRDLPPLSSAAAMPAGPRAARGFALALLGGGARKGAWTPPEHLYALAVCGGVKLDFRGARLPAGVTRVTAIACMGGIEVIVPPGLSVEVSGLGVLGGVDHLERESGDGPGAARLQVTAFACMGGVDVTTRPSERAEAATPERLRRRG